MFQKQWEPRDAPCCSWIGDYTPGMHPNELGTSPLSSSRAGRGFTSTPCAVLSSQVNGDGAGGEAVVTKASGRCLQGTQPCPQCWGMCSIPWSCRLRAAMRRGGILWQHPLRNLGLRLNKWKKIHLASKILTFKAISSPGWPGWRGYAEHNWSEQNIWRGRIKTGQLGKQMFFFPIMLWTLSNGSPWSFLIK